eukprot:gene5651-7036_t
MENEYFISKQIKTNNNSSSSSPINIYQGRKKQTLDCIVLKSIPIHLKSFYLTEIEIYRELNHHENIVSIYDSFYDKSNFWIVKEYCSGHSLLEALKQDHSYPEYTIQLFSFDIISGLLFLHSRGIIYNDLSPSNILFDTNGILKLNTSPISSIIINDVITGNNNNNNNNTNNNNDIHSLKDYTIQESFKSKNKFYQAPELFCQGYSPSISSDLWSLGIILYELGSGKLPFYSNDQIEFIDQVLYKDFQLPNELSDDFKDLISKLLVKDPNNRITWNELLSHRFWNFTIDISSINQFNLTPLSNSNINTPPILISDYLIATTPPPFNINNNNSTGNQDKIDIEPTSLELLDNNDNNTNNTSNIEITISTPPLPIPLLQPPIVINHYQDSSDIEVADEEEDEETLENLKKSMFKNSKDFLKIQQEDNNSYSNSSTTNKRPATTSSIESSESTGISEKISIPLPLSPQIKSTNSNFKSKLKSYQLQSQSQSTSTSSSSTPLLSPPSLSLSNDTTHPPPLPPQPQQSGTNNNSESNSLLTNTENNLLKLLDIFQHPSDFIARPISQKQKVNFNQLTEFVSLKLKVMILES